MLMAPIMGNDVEQTTLSSTKCSLMTPLPLDYLLLTPTSIDVVAALQLRAGRIILYSPSVCINLELLFDPVFWN